jgi:hypothetical protein
MAGIFGPRATLYSPIMSDNRFLEQEPFPDTAAIKAALGAKYPWYEAILEAAKGFEQEWKYYGKKYGWKLKVHDGAKALFELGVAGAGIRLGMAVRERELRSLREEPAIQAGLAGLLDEKASREGWGLRLMIDEERRLAQAIALIRAVAEIRQNQL